MGRLSVGFSTFLWASGLIAQQPAAQSAEPRFEVVSIRAVPPNAPPVMRDFDFTPVLPGGQYVDSRAWLPVMIAFAYDMKNVNLGEQVVGLPKWAENQVYMVAAKPANGFPNLRPIENQQQVRLMVRAMLADRFHLLLHAETRQRPVFKLEVAKAGVRIKEVDPPVFPAKEAPVGAAMENDGGIRMVASKSTMAGLTRALGLVMGRPVVDETGLKGYYDFDVRWRGPEAAGQAADTQFGGAELIGLLISNLQNQFGLHLTSTTGPVEYWVVDHVEPPTDN